MNDKSKIKHLVRKNILLFSGLLFVISTLLLFGVYTIQRTPVPQDIMIWLQVGEEVLKGLLAAAAVTFLYDWILREESAQQISVAVSQALQEQLSGLKARSAGYTRYDYVFEALLHPFEETSYSRDVQQRFCRFCVHTRFRSPYLGDTVRFALVRTREQVEQLRKDPSCLFRWQLDTFPSDDLDETWMDVTNFRVSDQTWKKEKVKISDDAVIVTFRRTSPLQRPPSDVLYEFDLRTIDVIRGTLALVDHYTFYTLIRPTFRIDGRPLGAKNIYADMSFDPQNVLQGPYVNAQESAGTWQIYVDGILEPIQTIRFYVEGVQPKQQFGEKRLPAG